jgi:hypothetical protein
MNNNKPILYISIYYRGSSKSKTKINKQLTSYTKRLISNPWEPDVNICLDTFDAQEEKQIQQELMYDTVITYNTKQVLTTIKDLYTIVILLISLTRQRLYVNKPNSKTEDLMIISIIPSNADDQSNNDYDIQWSLGQ